MEVLIVVYPGCERIMSFVYSTVASHIKIPPDVTLQIRWFEDQLLLLFEPRVCVCRYC
jgi:hypothetical protein